MNGQLRKHFPVEGNISFCTIIHERRIVGACLSRCAADTGDPRLPHRPFLLFAANVPVLDERERIRERDAAEGTRVCVCVRACVCGGGLARTPNEERQGMVQRKDEGRIVR